jgi:hypothetical protein
MSDVSEKLEGFGGWLLLIAIGQWLGLFGTVGDLLLDLPDYLSGLGDPATRRVVVGQAAIEIFLLLFMFYTTLMMAMKRHEFPTLFRLQLALAAVVPLASAVWLSHATGKPLEGVDFAGTAAQSVIAVIGASISILYSLRSQRVRNTFIY